MLLSLIVLLLGLRVSLLVGLLGILAINLLLGSRDKRLSLSYCVSYLSSGD